jgi:DNA-3-methyladenine glycosylase I
MPELVTRCFWAGNDPLMVAYHDEEWGVPCHDDRELFERLMLECFQAGLSWSTILRKREHFRRAFEGFDLERVARYDEPDFARLLADPGIVRNRLKVRAAATNAQAFLRVQEEHGSFDQYLWAWVDGQPLRDPGGRSAATIPASTPLSDALSRDLKKRGFTFVGTTIVYAYLQSVGLVDDHTDDCFRSVSRAAG